ncbi:MAG: hypothetical protein WBM13_11155 [Bacteroidia bacterium]
MKKNVIYILLPIVLIVWGTIIYRIFNTVNHTTALNTNTSAITNANFSNVLDTFSINPIYNDPFIRKKQVIEPILHTQTTIAKPTKEKELVKKNDTDTQNNKNWPNIIYHGRVKNVETQQQFAIVQINGLSVFMKSGDVESELKLLKITDDSIEVSFQNNKKIIKK